MNNRIATIDFISHLTQTPINLNKIVSNWILSIDK